MYREDKKSAIWQADILKHEDLHKFICTSETSGYYDKGKIKLSSILVDTMELFYWSVNLTSKEGGDGVKGLKGKIIILACCVFYFIREHENQVLNPINDIFNMIIKLVIFF